jgi:hypothetical protein
MLRITRSPTMQMVTLFCLIIAVYTACSSLRDPIGLDSIASSHVSLSDPDEPSYWGLEGFVPKKHGSKLLTHFTPAPCHGLGAKWEGLSVITIQLKQGEDMGIQVCLTQSNHRLLPIGLPLHNSKPRC